MVEERDVLSPERDDMSVMVVGVMVATRTEVTGDGGEENTGLTMRSFKVMLDGSVPCSPVGRKCLT